MAPWCWPWPWRSPFPWPRPPRARPEPPPITEDGAAGGFYVAGGVGGLKGTGATTAEGPAYAGQDELDAAYGDIADADPDTDGFLDAVDRWLEVYDRLSPEDQAANADARDYVAGYRDLVSSGKQDDGVMPANTYGQITVKYVVNGHLLRTDTLSSGRYIQIGNRVPYVADLLAGTEFEDYDWGDVTRIECRPLQYFPGSAHTLREGQHIDHSGNYKTHTITYTTSKWGPKEEGGPVGDGNGGGDPSNEAENMGSGTRYAWSQTIVYHANYPGGRDPQVTVRYNIKSWTNMYNLTAPNNLKSFAGCGFTVPDGYSLVDSNWYEAKTGSAATHSMGGRDFTFRASNNGKVTHLWARYKPNTSYGYVLNYDYYGGVLDGSPSDADKALDLSDATHVFTAKSGTPVRKGYEFDGWTHSGVGSYATGKVSMSGKANLVVSGTLSASWKAIPGAKAPLMYDANGGVDPPDVQTVDVGGDGVVAGAGDMSWPNHEFKGWRR